MKYLVFSEGKSLFSTDVEKVETIEKNAGLVSVDSENRYFRGFFILRGKPVPVFSLCGILGDDNCTDGSILMIMNTEEGKIGILVDDVTDVVDINEDIEGGSEEIAEKSFDMGDRTVFVLNIDSILKKMDVNNGGVPG